MSAPVQREASTDAFEFVRELATELTTGDIELPSFPEVAAQVQKVLSQDDSDSARVVRVLGAEPMLATRVLSMANAAALNPGGKSVSDLRTAVTRLGFDSLRSAAIGFAMAQIQRAKQFKGIERHLSALWQQSVLVAALAFVVARRTDKASPDTAMLTGLVHGVGKLYILTHSTKHPALFGEQEMYQRIVHDWHGNIAKALLEGWYMAEEIVIAVHSFEDQSRELRGVAGALADVLDVADMLSACKDDPDSVPALLVGRKAVIRLGLDAEICQSLLVESGEELAALRDALGHN
ncbi:MAG TPA: HDOD domain-containing protein [Steroidobacteraceae bacterium]|jgi:HD-like signal output (HDOD) protein|nr:HDOD domain-containing protein [Steroidobacteraceae bacterium]